MKNFIKMIRQVHEERFMKVFTNMIAKKIPVAFLSIDSVNQAVEGVKNIREQGLNIVNLFVTDATPPREP